MSGIGNIFYKVAKYLAAILNPLAGKNRFTIKNSEDFVTKIKDLEVPPLRKMVSYDVSTLFRSIPVGEAIRVIHGRLEKDASVSERCELSKDQVITVLEFCFNTIYFVCDGVFYHQIQDPPPPPNGVSYLSRCIKPGDGRFGEDPRQNTNQATCLVPLHE